MHKCKFGHHCSKKAYTVGKGNKPVDSARRHRPYSCGCSLWQLLAPEVRKEQNILLQCIRYVVRTNFLGHRQQPQQQESSSEEKEGVTVSAGSATVEEQNSYNNEPSESISDT